MFALETTLSWLSFFCALLVLLVSPWLFGGWEMWWFWPLVAALFVSVFLFSLRVMLGRAEVPTRRSARRRAALCLGAWGAFLLYDGVRFMTAEVFMDAERSFLLWLTPFILALVIVFGFSRRQLNALAVLLGVNLFALGAYGIVNHYLTGSERVMWMPGFAQYILEDRATGSYYCPDHFSGVMELALGVGLGVLLSRGVKWPWKMSAIPLLLVAGWAIFLSKSRGGGLTVALMLAAALAWGLSEWRPAVRWTLRGGAVLLVVLAGVALWFAGREYVERFEQYPWKRIQTSDRYRMASAALRAWQTSRVFGIGPGMHQDLWPHYAATPDGDPATGKWPTFPNNTFHSYEVHSDWTQLLEEYGLVGFVLFLAAAGSVLAVLIRGRRRALRRVRMGWADPQYWTLQAALLASLAMAFHSVGDFNLQMPATVWMLAAIVSMSLAHVLQEP